MSTQLLTTLAIALPFVYLAVRWCRAQLAMRRLRNLSHLWTAVEQTWEHLGSLAQGAHSQTLRTAFATLQRGRLTRLRTMAPNHDPAKVHLRLTSQFLRGQFQPTPPRVPPKTKVRLQAVQALRADLASKGAQQTLEPGLRIRADAELNQWQARLELDDFTASAMRDALLGKRREALQGIKMAMACLPRLPTKDADIWRTKLGAEQRRLRLSAGQRSAKLA